ncbi:MAG: hypothetical protein JST82_01290 [Bacteroidetes bacterium]|nr:hypothetical protein [Bacteroidota bacterium]
MKKIIRQLFTEFYSLRNSASRSSNSQDLLFWALKGFSAWLWSILFFIALIIENNTNIEVLQPFQNKALNTALYVALAFIIYFILNVILKPLEQTVKETPKSKNSQTLIIFTYITVMLFAIAMLTLKHH